MDKKIKIAILTSGRNKPLGTFIKNYIDFLPYDKIVLFGGFVPYFYMGTTKRKQSLIRYFFTLLSFKNENRLKKIIKNRLKKILISEKITGFLVNEFDIDEMAEKMIYLVENPVISKQMGENARNFIFNNFSMKKHIEHVDSAIKILV